MGEGQAKPPTHRARIRKEIQDLGNSSPWKSGVGVEEQKDLCCGRLDAGIELRPPTSGPNDDSSTVVLGHCDCLVTAAAVDYDELVGGTDEWRQTLVECLLLVQGGDDDCYSGLCQCGRDASMCRR